MDGDDEMDESEIERMWDDEGLCERQMMGEGEVMYAALGVMRVERPMSMEDRERKRARLQRLLEVFERLVEGMDGIELMGGAGGMVWFRVTEGTYKRLFGEREDYRIPEELREVGVERIGVAPMGGFG